MAEAQQESYTEAANTALSASAQVHSEIQKKLSTDEVPTLDDLRRWKKLTAKTNKSVSRATRSFWERENRLTIERNTIRAVIRKERLDLQANSARVFDRIRHHSSIGVQDTDRIITHANQVQTMLNALAPVQPTSFHGAAWLALDMTTNADGLLRLTNDAA